jgi:8-oxo-dGTP diphosphatase
MGRRLRYIEFDGQVYLVRRNGLWTFPDADERLPFAVREQHAARIMDADVAYCRPTLAAFPKEWVYKDDVPHLPDIDPVVRQAINASLARCVVGVLVVDAQDRVLMVKSNRGFTKGMWNIPGGFIDYGEHPEEAAVREVREETGIDVRLGPLLGVYKERFQSPYFMYGFMYEGTPASTVLRTDPNEIDEASWMAPERAHRETRNPFARAAFEKRFGLKAPKPG